MIKSLIKYGLKKIIDFFLKKNNIKYYLDLLKLRSDRISKSSRITTINFYVNNICNSHCVMCNVWKNDNYDSMTLEQFSEVLSDKMFKDVRHIGITGGEPTLQNNLVDYFDVSISKLKKLTSLSLITNCLDSDQVIKRVTEVNNLCSKRKKKFSLMLSLDGIDSIHDKNRGTKNAFSNFEIVCLELQRRGIRFSTGTTITSINVWDLDKILCYVKDRKFPHVFRLAEFIDRLDNINCERYIKNFSDEEKYQIALFFKKMELEPGSDKDYYRNLHDMILGKDRTLSCDYQGNSICLNHRGEILYCAPKSPILGNLIVNKGSEIISETEGIKDYIAINHCSRCVHYSGQVLNPEEKRKEEQLKAFFRIENYFKSENLISQTNKTIDRDSFFITGWYGTETVGDKAILGGIIQRILSENPEAKIFVSSLYPFITEQTKKELDFPNLTVVPVYDSSFFQIIPQCSQIIIGGGPLMELEELSVLLWAFRLGIKAKKIILGCGIGPLSSKERTDAVFELVKMADEVLLRDDSSRDFLIKNGVKKEINVIDDPAIQYIQTKIDMSVAKKNQCGFYLRELTHEYMSNLAVDEFNLFRDSFEEAIVKNINIILKETDLDIVFYAMHNFKVGNDDRDYLFRLKIQYFNNEKRVSVYNELSSVDSIAKSMNENKYNICMRYHSLVFANELDTEYSVIDYTSGGKIKSYLEMENKLDRLISMDKLINDNQCIFKSMTSKY